MREDINKEIYKLDIPEISGKVFMPREDNVPSPEDGGIIAFKAADNEEFFIRYHLASLAGDNIFLFHGVGEVASDWDEAGRDLLTVAIVWGNSVASDPSASSKPSSPVTPVVSVQRPLLSPGIASPFARRCGLAGSCPLPSHKPLTEVILSTLGERQAGVNASSRQAATVQAAVDRISAAASCNARACRRRADGAGRAFGCQKKGGR